MPGVFRAGQRFVRGHTPIRTPGILLAIISQDVVSPIFESGEEGDQSNYIVAVTFSETITSTDYSAGVTIKIDGITATISLAAVQSDNRTVFFTVTAGAVSNSVVTFTYSDIVGDYHDLAGNQMGDITNAAIINNVGRHLRFNDAPNAMHLAWI